MRARDDDDVVDRASSPERDATPTKSALAEHHIRSSRSETSRRYAGIVPGGVATRIGRADECARDRALKSRAEALRRALRETDAREDAAGTSARLYEYASVLQEQAERCGRDGDDGGMLEELTMRACDAYARAMEIDPGRQGVLYNWGIALGDRAEHASARGEDEKARRLWDEAIDKYERAVKSKDASTVTTQQAAQVLNNLGLAYQSRGGCVDFPRSASSLEAAQRAREERVKFLSAGVRKFRRAIRLDPSFDRAAYNLGTVVYALSVEYASMARLYPRDGSLAPMSLDYAAAAAVYVGLALANDPDSDVYSTSFDIVKNYLPAPHIVDDVFEYATNASAYGDFVAARLTLTPRALRLRSIRTTADATADADADDDDEQDVLCDLPLASIAAIDPLEDASLAADRARARLPRRPHRRRPHPRPPKPTREGQTHRRRAHDARTRSSRARRSRRRAPRRRRRARPCDRCLVSRVTTHVYPRLHQPCTHTRRITTRDMSPRDALVVLGRRQCAPATARGARARLSIERPRERVARIFSRVSFANAVDAEAPTREETPETPWGFDFGAKPRPRRARRIVGEGCLKRPRGRRSPRRSERSRRACGAGARGA